jgi:hypothetical protein
MSVLTITFIIILGLVAFILINRAMINEEDLIRKAEKNWFYHTIAKMTSAKYNGYIMGDEEDKAMEDYLSKPSEYETHPIGSYFKLCKSLKDTLSTCGNFHNYRLNFNLGEVGTGFAVLVVFAAIVTLGVVLC